MTEGLNHVPGSHNPDGEIDHLTASNDRIAYIILAFLKKSIRELLHLVPFNTLEYAVPMPTSDKT